MIDYGETRLQIATVDYLNGEIHRGRNIIRVQKPFDIMFLHPVNEFKDKTEAFWAVRKGILPGITDLLFWWFDGITRTGVIELKYSTALSEAQRRFRDRCLELHIPHNVCRKVVEVRDTLISWGLECKNMNCIEPGLSAEQKKQLTIAMQRPYE